MNIRRILVLLGLSGIALMAWGIVVASANWGPLNYERLIVNRVYAYRGWQSTGVQLSEGDMYTIRAKGKWLYSPYAGPNGPEGHRRFWAPDFYPLPRVPGGALIGRIGESGSPFYVGSKFSGRAGSSGLLYLRIDDDLLGDNQGYLTFEVQVVKPQK